MANTILELQNITRKYNEGNPAVNGINLQVKQYEKLALVGETGSGKSTLLKIAAGLIPSETGKVVFNGSEIENPKDKLIPGHPDIAYLSQHFELPKFITVEEHLFDPYEMTEEEAQRVYRACQIDHLLNADTRFLSGGEKQRVALAKLILAQPQLLFLDEPFSNLDPIRKQEIKKVVYTLNEELLITTVMVSHEPQDVLPWADSIVVLRDSGLVQHGTPQDIYDHPNNEYVAGLFGKYNLLDAKDWGNSAISKYKMIGDRILIRPEQFCIHRESSMKGYEAIIQEIKYFGSYDELLVSANGFEILLKANVGEFKREQKIRISSPLTT